MESHDVKLGIEHRYIEKKSGLQCYVTAIDVDDGACIILEMFDVKGEDITGELRRSEACFLSPLPS